MYQSLCQENENTQSRKQGMQGVCSVLVGKGVWEGLLAGVSLSRLGGLQAKSEGTRVPGKGASLKFEL